MFDTLFSLVFFPFEMDVVLFCLAFSYALAAFGLIRRFLISDFSFR